MPFYAMIVAAMVGVHSAIPQLEHIIIIMQENRSFDSYFGTYPGADGIPMKNGKPVICNPNPRTHGCDYSYHDYADTNYGGPHDTRNERADVDGGKMDGFVAQAEQQQSQKETVMGYHTALEVPNYWSYARLYVLQDAMFSSSTAYSGPQHVFMLSNWSAVCSVINDPSSCTSGYNENNHKAGSFAWTDITYLLHNAGVPWKYYVFTGQSPDVVNPDADGGIRGVFAPQNSVTGSDWNPLPFFTDVRKDHELGNVVDGTTFYQDAAQGTLPAVSWVVPANSFSEHPPSSVRAGMMYVTGLINSVMKGPNWKKTAIFVTWDEWGGMFDHVPPPQVDWGGFGIRVPGLLVSPWAKHDYIDHQTLSFDAYNKLIEDLFLGGQRLDPANDGRWDPRPDVREAYAGLGDLLNEFDFSQTPRAPLLMRNAITIRPFTETAR